jgi:hypothetical protein
MTDAEFLAAFEGCTLTREQWTHTAHVRMAWLYLQTNEAFESVFTKTRQNIQRFNRAVVGKPDAYHETITYAFLRFIRDRLQRDASGMPFESFCLRYPDLLSSAVLARYFSKELLDSSEARHEVVAPDLSVLP